MANELQTKLDAILNDKNTNLLPENLKAGVTCLGVEGNLREGGGDIPVKLFETVEEMQADADAKEGDLALVYREEIQNATVDSRFSQAKFPATVVLPEAMTDYVDVRYRAVDTSIMFDCWGNLDSSRFSMDCWSDTGSIRIEYESSDGMTYTRTDGGEEFVDFGTEIYYAYTDEWNDAIGKFIQIGGNVFEGLFTYNANYINKSRCRLFHKDDVTVSTDTDKLIRIGNNARYVDYDMLTLRNIFVQMEANGISGSNNVLYVKDGDLYVLKGATDRFNRLWLDSSTDKLTGFAPDAYGDMTSSAAYIYKLNVNDTNTPYELVETVYPTIAINNDNSNNRYSIILRDYDYCGLIFYSSENYSVSIPKTSYTIDTSLKTDSDYDASSIEHTEIPYKVEAIYLTANSQLNLTNADELLPGKTAYGKTGVIEGSNDLITPNSSFNDTTALLWTKIQMQYDEMEPRVLTDDDKTIDTSIYCIPTKMDGTPLYNTSNVTDMYKLLYGCSELTTIPLLNTSNVTSMDGMFTNCISLTKIPLLDTNGVTRMNNMFKNCTSLTTIPLLDASSVTDMGGMFYNCTSLTTIPLLDTSSVLYMNSMFYGCTSLTEIPLLDTSNNTTMQNMFYGCTSLTTVPILNTSKVTNMSIMFSDCTSLSEESLNNILAMCINATSYTKTKTLKVLGLISSQATTCQSLSNYQAFLDAGWTTGY